MIQLELASAYGERQAELGESLLRSRDARGCDGLGREGFARDWFCSIDQLVAHAATVFAEEPFLRRLILCTSPDVQAQLRALAVVPELARVRELSISTTEQRTRPGSEGLATLLASPHWPRLEGLQLLHCAIGDAGAKLLARAALSELQALDLTDNDIGPDGVVALAGSPVLTRLRMLILSRNNVGWGGVAALADAGNRMPLELVELYEAGVTSAVVEPLAKRFPGIELRYLPPPEPQPAEEADDTFTKGPFV
ncbi:MAG: hypothetical protein H0V17_31890 [Deltaproteobacteria bacterium]|nr:hypothetical protein [Deltaproteobacteria bacterium]